jgi:hypothetical protein
MEKSPQGFSATLDVVAIVMAGKKKEISMWSNTQSNGQ